MNLKKPFSTVAIVAILTATALTFAGADEPPNPAAPRPAKAATNAVVVHSAPGNNAWNTGQPAPDWWEEIRRQHGHVGPWNVLGWRIAQAALREFKTDWGRHDLEIICYTPPQTPFTCLVDGISMGTGNSLGRLDVRMAEVFTVGQCFVAVRRKDGQGPVLEFRPGADYLKSILNQPVEHLETLSKTSAELPEAKLFILHSVPR